MAVGIPGRLREGVAACGKGRGENLPESQLGRAVFADGVGLLGDVGNAGALQQYRVCERLDAGFGGANFLGDLCGRCASADAGLNFRRAQADCVRAGVAVVTHARARLRNRRRSGCGQLWRSGRSGVSGLSRGGCLVVILLCFRVALFVFVSGGRACSRVCVAGCYRIHRICSIRRVICFRRERELGDLAPCVILWLRCA